MYNRYDNLAPDRGCMVFSQIDNPSTKQKTKKQKKNMPTR